MRQLVAEYYESRRYDDDGKVAELQRFAEKHLAVEYACRQTPPQCVVHVSVYPTERGFREAHPNDSDTICIYPG